MWPGRRSPVGTQQAPNGEIDFQNWEQSVDNHPPTWWSVILNTHPRLQSQMYLEPFQNKLTLCHVGQVIVIIVTIVVVIIIYHSLGMSGLRRHSG